MVIFFNNILNLRVILEIASHFISSKLNAFIITLLMPFSADNLKGL